MNNQRVIRWGILGTGLIAGIMAAAIKEAENNEQFFYGPVQSNKGTTQEEEDDDDDEKFSDVNETPKQVTLSQIKQVPIVPPPPPPPPQTNNKV